jgi:hypothetical protein
MWTADEEEALIERNILSIKALALQHGDAISDTCARSIAFGQALATLHHRTTLRVYADTLRSLRDERRSGRGNRP